MKTRRQPIKGFTLIELLTVIAIIGILASILIPVVGTVRENARRSQCMSNMRQIGLAVIMYEGENGHLPGPIFRRVRRPVTDQPEYRDLNFFLEDYMGPRSEVWNCPTNEMTYSEEENPGNTVFILMNNLGTNPPRWFGYGNPGENDRWMPLPISQIISPSRTPPGSLVREMHRIMLLSDADGLNYSPAHRATGAASFQFGLPPVHGDGRRNYVFFDGHAEFLGRDQMPVMAEYPIR